MKCNLRIGLFGGSFDPVHTGHIGLAKAARDEFKLDKVVFIPAKHPPHKLKKHLAPAGIRLKMLAAAVKPYKDFAVSRYELRRKPPTYTFQTAAYFKRLYPGSKLFFIIGMDSLAELKTWKKIGSLTKQLLFLTGKRKGAKATGQGPVDSSVRILKSRLPAVSSTQIRRLVSEGKPIKGLVPPGIEKILLDSRIYSEKPNG
jgi:nicotinate-nucleotide adenylyltransferase